MEVKLSIIALVAFCALLGAIGQVLFKISSQDLTANPITWITNWKLVAGLVLYATATILFILSLKQGKLSILYPIIATSYIWVTIFSVWILGEAMTLFRWIGIVAILIGVALIVK